jgi:hypothetical protein
MQCESELPPWPGANEISARVNGHWRTYRADQPDRPMPALMFPGAFNPLHDGHRRMAEVAAEITTRAVEFEISIENVDKVPLQPDDVLRRVGQFADRRTVWLTSAATFVDKACWFPNATFIVGADTIVRIADPQYYGGDAASRDEAVGTLGQCGCSFLVFGRVDTRQFRILSGLRLPEALLRLCTGVSAEQFRMDVSSTQLRTRG